MSNKTNLDDIDFKALSKTCKDEKDIPSLTKEFITNIMQSMLNSEIYPSKTKLAI